jgi:Ion channel
MTVDSSPYPSRRVLRRVAERRASRSFGMVLALIVVSFAFAATASDAAWTTGVLVVLQGLTLIAAIWTSGLARTRSWLVFGLAMLTIAIALAVVSSAAGGADLTGAVGLVSALFIICVVVVIVRSIAWSPEVNAEIILGAICVYVSIGMIFLFAYGAVADIGSSAFFAQGGDGTRALRLYFSYVTLATLGYGDYTPATNIGHMLAVVEALLGQIYLVTVVALLVARLRVRPREAQ